MPWDFLFKTVYWNCLKGYFVIAWNSTEFVICSNLFLLHKGKGFAIQIVQRRVSIKLLSLSRKTYQLFYFISSCVLFHPWNVAIFVTFPIVDVVPWSRVIHFYCRRLISCSNDSVHSLGTDLIFHLFFDLAGFVRKKSFWSARYC